MSGMIVRHWRHKEEEDHILVTEKFAVKKEDKQRQKMPATQPAKAFVRSHLNYHGTT